MIKVTKQDDERQSQRRLSSCHPGRGLRPAGRASVLRLDGSRGQALGRCPPARVLLGTVSSEDLVSGLPDFLLHLQKQEGCARCGRPCRAPSPLPGSGASLQLCAVLAPRVHCLCPPAAPCTLLWGPWHPCSRGERPLQGRPGLHRCPCSLTSTASPCASGYQSLGKGTIWVQIKYKPMIHPFANEVLSRSFPRTWAPCLTPAFCSN